MTAEENFSNNEQPNIDVPKIIFLIIESMKQTVPHFKFYIASDFHKKSKLSEDDYSQIYIEQAQILIRKNDYPFNISSQYRDIYNLSKGFSDFYFYPNEQDKLASSIFSVESKRLPSPGKSREKEYVIGDSNNGGIERYKIEKHGKNLKDGGLVGFIEKGNFSYWEITINNWIKDLANAGQPWMADEILSGIKSDVDYYHLKSIAHRKSSDINLFHLWVALN